MEVCSCTTTVSLQAKCLGFICSLKVHNCISAFQSRGCVDLLVQELTWEDREKVLRLLFAKINNQAQPMYYANLPGHSFQVAEDSVETMQGLRTEAGPAQLV